MRGVAGLMVTVLTVALGCSGPPPEKDTNNGRVIIIDENNGTANSSTNNDDPAITECGPGRSLCNGACVDTEFDSANCGGCSTSCSDGSVCAEGSCVTVPEDCRTEGECPARFFCDENTGLCQPGCTSNTDCPSGSYCELGSHTCLCTDEAKVVCGSECVDEGPLSCGPTCETCPVVGNGSATCDEGACGVQCEEGYMLCDGRCAACPSSDGAQGLTCLGDQCVVSGCEEGYEICDGACAACPATSGDESLGCDGGECIITDCPAGTKLCGGECATCPEDPNGTTTCQGSECVLVCGTGFHSCGDFCAYDDDPANCGSSCAYCPDDPNGFAECTDGACGLACSEGYRECDDACSECPTGPGVVSTRCAGGSCVVQSCAAGYQPCTGGCCQDAPDGVAYTSTDFAADVSLALDSRGYPHIGFGSATSSAIYYIYWDGSAWQEEYVGSGWHVDIELDLMDRPHVAIWRRNPDTLYYGVRDPVSGWTLERADTAFTDVGMTPDLELVGNTPHIAHYDLQQKNLRYAVKSGGSWSDEVVASTDDIGFSPSLEMVNGEPHIVYRDETSDRTLYSWYDGSWQQAVLDGQNNTGNYSSLAVDAAGVLHVALEEEAPFVGDQEHVRYTNTSGGSWGASSSIAEGAMRPSLVLTSAGDPVIVYRSTATASLFAADGKSGWTTTELDSAAALAEENDAEYSAMTGKVHVVYTDFTNRTVKYLSFDP